MGSHFDFGQSSAIAKAMARVAERWGLTEASLSELLGMHLTGDQKLADCLSEFIVHSESAKRAGHILRLFEALTRLLDDDQGAGQWIQVWNADLQYRPMDQMNSCEGIVAICEYVEAFVHRS